ncbi:pyruvate dehydrogenase complex dihydrolipoamide acetyltransferase component (E2) [Actinomortierella ambigua]|uniref:Dihydrolipoamide acetyltransferase component of pyruvate dehydrogenase complex n=1 Tax=Actinomortierella ambigua TaxID=1343610 RepID=A0A9P6UBJ3_9FUNG|nr:pyruvate dehydrogenase complex dihydrolipoamide acetyltransferase component (E2) [Actinomortierella ambigua]
MLSLSKVMAMRAAAGAKCETVSAGDVLLEIETDKATMDVEAADDGILAKILHPAGSKVSVNETIALLAEEGDDLSNIEVPKTSSKPAAAPAKEEQKEQPAAKKEAPKPTPGQKAATPSSDLVSPAVAHLLLKHHVKNVTEIPATGPKGRVLKGDVLAYLGMIKARPAPVPTRPQPDTLPAASAPAPKKAGADAGAAFTDEATSGMRKVIASRLSESKATVPHSYVSRDIGVDNLLKIRQMLSDEFQVKVSVNDMLIKAASLALKDVPESNVQFAGGETTRQVQNVDISVAVATPKGLLTPIVQGADRQGLSSISAQIKDMAARAKEGKLRPEEYQGGSFSISNLGMFGVNHFSAIINPPQACNLAVGAARTVFLPPAVEENEILNDAEVFEYLSGQRKKAPLGKSITATAAAPSTSSEAAAPAAAAPKQKKHVVKSADDLDLLEYLGNPKVTQKPSKTVQDQILARLKPQLEATQVVNVTLSIDERVVDSEVAGKFLDRLSHYVHNPETMLL